MYMKLIYNNGPTLPGAFFFFLFVGMCKKVAISIGTVSAKLTKGWCVVYGQVSIVILETC